MTDTLESILEGTDTDDTATAAASTENDKAPVAESDEAGAEGDDKAEPPAAEDDDGKGHIPKAAVLDERRKRQSAEQRADAAERKLAELEKGKEAPAQEEEERPDLLEDPDGALDHIDRKIERANLKTRISLSQDFMRDTKEDYDEMEGVFIELAKENPALGQQMIQSPNPAKFVYQTAKNHQEMKALSDPKALEALKEKLRKEILEEEGKEPAEEPVADTPADKRKKDALKVPDLNNATSATSGNATPTDESLKDILGR